MSEIIVLYPDGAPVLAPGIGPEALFRQPTGPGPEADWLRNISEPSLTVVRPPAGEASDRGVIVCPGGGWRVHAWEHEGLDMARWFAARGVTAFVLRYRVLATPSDPVEFDAFNAAFIGQQTAMNSVSRRDAARSLRDLTDDPNVVEARAAAADDGRKALATVREQAADFGLDPARIGMVGFSAGAFLTADVALNPGGSPPAFAAPIYGGETNGVAVPPDAPPLFTCITQDDILLFKVVVGLFSDWSDADRPAELHVFEKGGHGFGMVAQGRPVDRWLGVFEAWLKDQGFLSA